MKQHTPTCGHAAGVIGHFLLAAWLMATPAQADTSLDLLPAITTPAGTDIYYCVQSATDYKCTLDQIRAWLSTGSFTTLSTTGNVGVG
ncbi:MAG: hypothetical protein OEZ32_12175, partial [Nitrospinota bacterium]|nr:hypothetical protein [Nitrospinota bacterium]